MSCRRAGSVRFDPYWKAQWYDETSLTWRDIQRSYSSREKAERYAQDHANLTGNRCRLMKITETGRAPEPGIISPA